MSMILHERIRQTQWVAAWGYIELSELTLKILWRTSEHQCMHWV